MSGKLSLRQFQHFLYRYEQKSIHYLLFLEGIYQSIMIDHKSIYHISNLYSNLCHLTAFLLYWIIRLRDVPTSGGFYRRWVSTSTSSLLVPVWN